MLLYPHEMIEYDTFNPGKMPPEESWTVEAVKHGIRTDGRGRIEIP
jgi:hypothetical protein